MTNIIHYVRRPGVFGPDVVAAMGNAYEQALATFDTEPVKTVREVIARRIMSLAQKGDRDPHVLLKEALAGVYSKSERPHKFSSGSSHQDRAS